MRQSGKRLLATNGFIFNIQIFSNEKFEQINKKCFVSRSDVERALTRFVARTGETLSFFLTEDLTYFPRNYYKLHSFYS